MNDKNFNKAMELTFGIEGGYSNNKYDKGGKTNLGVTQATYNGWRKKKGLPSKNVQQITTEEAKQLYYEEFWKVSGADKLKDPREAYILFDMAVNSNPYTAKKLFKESNGNIYTFLKNRKEFYKNYINKNPEQKVFENGWNNRLKNVENNINTMLEGGFYTPEYIKEITPYDKNYNGMLKSPKNLSDNEKYLLKNKYLYLKHKNFPTGFAAPVQNSNHIFTPEEIGNMSHDEFSQKEQAIMQQVKDGLIQNQIPQVNYSGYTNPVTGSNQIFSQEDIGLMSSEEYSKNERAIQAQLNSIGIPANNELQSAVQNDSGLVYVNSYTRSDGTEVRGYYRSK